MRTHERDVAGRHRSGRGRARRVGALRRGAVALLALTAPAALLAPAPAHAEDVTIVTVRGVVTEAGTGRPLPGVCVTMPWTGTEGECSGADGSFSRTVYFQSFEDSITLSVVPEEDDRYHEFQELTVTRASASKVDVVLQRLAVVTGRVRSAATGLPVAGMCPAVAPGTQLTRSCSGADGSWALWRIAPDDAAAVELTGDGYRSTYVPSGQRLTAARRFDIRPGDNVLPDTLVSPSATVVNASAGTYPSIVTTRVGKGTSDFVPARAEGQGELLPEGGASWSIQPGKYKIAFTEWGGCDSSDVVDVCDEGAPVWYPGTYDPGAATAVQLRSGQTLTYTGPAPTWRTRLTIAVRGLPTGTTIEASAIFPSGVAYESPQAMRNGSLPDWASIYAKYLPPSPLKLRLTATKPNGSKVSWWYGGSSFATATTVPATATTVTVPAPAKR